VILLVISGSPTPATGSNRVTNTTTTTTTTTATAPPAPATTATPPKNEQRRRERRRHREPNKSVCFNGGDPFTKVFFEDQREFVTKRDGASHTGKKSDVKISCQDGHFFAHRAIILSASEYLQTMLEGVSGKMLSTNTLTVGCLTFHMFHEITVPL